MDSLAKRILDMLNEADERDSSLSRIEKYKRVLLSHLMKLFALNKSLEWERSTRGWIDGTISRNIGIMFVPNTKNNISLEREDFYNGIMSYPKRRLLNDLIKEISKKNSTLKLLPSIAGNKITNEVLYTCLCASVNKICEFCYPFHLQAKRGTIDQLQRKLVSEVRNKIKGLTNDNDNFSFFDADALYEEGLELST